MFDYLKELIINERPPWAALNASTQQAAPAGNQQQVVAAMAENGLVVANNDGQDQQPPQAAADEGSEQLVLGDNGQQQSPAVAENVLADEVKGEKRKRGKNSYPLYKLTRLFVKAGSRNNFAPIDPIKLSNSFGCQRRRIYDITNVLRGIRFTTISSNSWQWHGHTDGPDDNEELDEELNNALDKLYASRKQNIADLGDDDEDQTDKDKLIEEARQVLADVKNYAGNKVASWVTIRDLCGAVDMNEKVLVIQPPSVLKQQAQMVSQESKGKQTKKKAKMAPMASQQQAAKSDSKFGPFKICVLKPADEQDENKDPASAEGSKAVPPLQFDVKVVAENQNGNDIAPNFL